MYLDGHPTEAHIRARMFKQQPANCWILTENPLFPLLSLPHRRKPRHGAGYLDHRSAANSATMPPASTQATAPTCSPTRVGLLGGWVPSLPENVSETNILGQKQQLAGWCLNISRRGRPPVGGTSTYVSLGQPMRRAAPEPTYNTYISPVYKRHLAQK